MFRRLFIQGVLAGAPCLALAWLAGAVLRDRTTATALLYYIPAPVFLACGVLSLVLLIRWGRGRTAMLVGCIAAAALVKILAVDLSWKKVPGGEGQPLRVVHWNVSHGDAGRDSLLQVLQEDKADLYVLSEFPDDDTFAGFAEELVPGGATSSGWGILIVSRLPLKPFRVPAFTGGGLCGVRVVMPEGGYVEVLAVDFVSDPRRSRRQRVELLVDWVKSRRRNAPLLIVGDFNTPRDSINFEPLRSLPIRHVYEEGGRGQIPYTWPLPCPFYAIDHAWSYRLYPESYRLPWSFASDHVRQVMDLRAR